MSTKHKRPVSVLTTWIRQLPTVEASDHQGNGAVNGTHADHGNGAVKNGAVNGIHADHGNGAVNGTSTEGGVVAAEGHAAEEGLAAEGHAAEEGQGAEIEGADGDRRDARGSGRPVRGNPTGYTIGQCW